MVQKVLTLTAWVFIAFLAYSSLTDVEFVDSIYYKLSPFLMRPSIWAYAHFEHLLVFMAFGVLLCFCISRSDLFRLLCGFFQRPGSWVFADSNSRSSWNLDRRNRKGLRRALGIALVAIGHFVRKRWTNDGRRSFLVEVDDVTGKCLTLEADASPGDQRGAGALKPPSPMNVRR